MTTWLLFARSSFFSPRYNLYCMSTGCSFKLDQALDHRMTFASLISTMLLFALFLTTSLLTRAAPLECHNEPGGSSNEILLQLPKIQSEMEILKENGTSIKAKDCADVYKSGGRISNVYTIEPRDGLGAFDVFCDQTTAGGGWIVLQKRLKGSMDFNRTWEEYKHGFGNFFTQEFWLGLEKIHRLTGNETANRLRIELGVTNEEPLYAEYGWFGIGNESTTYRLKLSNRWDGTVKNDSFGSHKNFSFATWDRDPAYGECNKERGGGWWYSKNCVVSSNLNGLYPSSGTPLGNIHWDHLGSTPEASAPENTEMKIRPVDVK